MNSITKTLLCACIATAAGTAFAQDAMKKTEPMATSGMAKKEMTMQDCKDHMAMAKKDGMKTDAMKTDGMKTDGMKTDSMKKDDASMKMDATCADMMKKDAMTKDQPMKK